MKKTVSVALFFALIFAILSQGCSNSTSEDNTQSENTQASMTTDSVSVMKVKAFNDVNALVNILSQNGIGTLNSWQNPMDMGWGSLTKYFQFGNPLGEYGLANNIAYYLEGSETTAKNLLISLNVNNPSENKQALKFLSKITDKTFKSLDLHIPSGLLNAIKLGKEFKSDNNEFKTSFRLDKSKIETWKVLIVSK